MRPRLALTVLLFASLAEGQAPPKKRVAVFDFENAAIQGGITSPFLQNNAPDMGKAAAELLITKLVKGGNVSVIERNAIDKLLAEQNLTNSDRTDPLTAAKLGRVLGWTQSSWGPSLITTTTTKLPAEEAPALAASAALQRN